MLVALLLLLFGRLKIRRATTRHWEEIIAESLARSAAAGARISKERVEEVAHEAYFRAAQLRPDRTVRLGDYHRTLLALLEGRSRHE